MTDLTIRAVAKEAGMSERTVFRYFATRDDFLDAAAAEAARRMKTPPPPSTIAELREFPVMLYKAFEERADLVRGALHTEIFYRVRSTAATGRWKAVSDLIDEYAPLRSKKERKLAAININYFLSASTWHYYRFNFGLTPAETIACAKTAIELTIEHISKA